MLDHGRIHQGHVREIRDVSTCTAQHVRAALSVLYMAQKIVSRQKHNMLSLLHVACLKLLVFFYLNLTNVCVCVSSVLHKRLKYISNVEFPIKLNVALNSGC